MYYTLLVIHFTFIKNLLCSEKKGNSAGWVEILKIFKLRVWYLQVLRHPH